ncbi:MAG: hypothetical protein JW829_12435 [Pirellulales bacterium]|nr:hypothetical protein [Pirellulales bacterium]
MHFLIVFGIVQTLTISAGIPATIEITQLPAYGTDDPLKGRVTGVNYTSYHVAPYIHVEGSGWWTKPTSETPTVQISANGDFEVNVVSGGLDHVARIYDLQVLPMDVMPIPASGASSVPTNPALVARTYRYRNGPIVEFANRSWAVKDARYPVGPGGNCFSALPQDIFVDPQGRLHLTITKKEETYWSTEVILTQSLGYGTYVLHTNYRADILDANTTFGAFTWDSFGDDTEIASWPFRELDFEDSRWGNPSDTTNSQAVVQPFNVPGNLIRWTLPDLSQDASLTRCMTWLPGCVHFVTALGHYSPGQIPADKIVDEWTYVEDEDRNHRVPEPGRETFRLNLWLNQSAPLVSAPIEVVVTDFAFTPPGDFDYDGDVDGTDFLRWQQEFSTNPFGSFDLALWKENFGAASPFLIADSMIVPEPGTMMILISVAIVKWFHRNLCVEH